MAREKQSVVIAEDYTILREGLRALISGDSPTPEIRHRSSTVA